MIRSSGGWARYRPAIAFLVALLAVPVAGAAQSITIDSFTTNQASLSLTFPPAGTSASSSVSGAGILGGERDLEINLTAGVIAGNGMSAVVGSGFFSYSQDATISGTGRIQWDGTDGSATLNPTGLGGLDLTAGGSQDAFVLDFTFDDLPVDVVIEVFSDAGNASSLTLTTPGLIFSTTNFVVPYSAFTTSLGAGADFSNVGAIVLTLGSSITAPDVVIDDIQTTSTLTASKTVAIINDVDGDGNADPGDTLRYTVVVSNPDDAFNAAATGVLYGNATPANTSLVTGSVTTTQGTVTAGNGGGDTSVGVNLGTIADGGGVTITFDVLINNPLPAGVTQIVCQGTVSSDTLTNLLTDDPTPPGPTDPTVIPVVADPLIVATKADALFVDGNSNGIVNPGDTIRYTVVITNNGNEDASGVVFTSGTPANTSLVVGSVTTTQGTVTTGNGGGDTSVAVNIGTIPGGGGSVTIQFRVTIDDPLAAGVTQIICQGSVTGTNIPSTVTDDPDTAAPNDPTVTPIVVDVVVQEIPTLGEWGLLALILMLSGLALRGMRKRATQAVAPASPADPPPTRARPR
ncbi:MAG TPA: IPTL-CTERM sorting domain-containing protein [Thermoanaerobaculia bacterium]|nr:IPTL-CTERM sorting domain-containing protein [Thermoanaerobaculia bacterium]